MLSAVYGEVVFTNLVENKWIKKYYTLHSIKTDKIDEQSTITHQKIDENKGFIEDFKALVTNSGQKPKTNTYMKEYLAH